MAAVYTDQRLNLSKLGKAFGRKPRFQNRTREIWPSGSASRKKLVCSAGDKPAGAKVRCPVVWIAGWRETKILKPIDRVSLGETTSHRAVTTVNANVASKGQIRGPSPLP